MKEALSTSARRVQEALAAAGFPFEVRVFPAGTRTAAEAAAAIGCTLGQIAKSIVFKAASGRPVLVVASGANRVDEAKVEALLGERIGRAEADFVREATGFAIGGVPPLGHRSQPLVLLDEDLAGYAEIWAAAGRPDSVFRLDPASLPRLSGGRYAAVKRD